MNAVCRQWVRECLARLPEPCSAVELGALNVNGTVRDLFACAYAGVDLRAGAGVDVLADAADWQPGELADVVLCLNMLEHAPDPAGIIANAWAMLRDGGALIVTAAGPDFPPHGCMGGAVGDEHYQALADWQLADMLDPFTSYEVEARDGLVCAVAVKEGEVPRKVDVAREEVGHPHTHPPRQYVGCTDCHRVLYLEDGPTCPECLAKRAAEDRAADAVPEGE